MLNKTTMVLSVLGLLSLPAQMAFAGGVGIKGGFYNEHVCTGCLDSREVGVKLGFFFDRNPNCCGGHAAAPVAYGPRYNPLAANCAPPVDPCALNPVACGAPAMMPVFAPPPPPPPQPVFLLLMPQPTNIVNNLSPAQYSYGSPIANHTIPETHHENVVENNKPVRAFW